MTGTALRAHLPVRAPLRPDEWPETYLISLVRAQGLRRPWGHDLELIRSVLPWEQPGAERSQRDSRNSAATYVQGRPQYGVAPLPPWASIVRAMPLRYCPHCLVETRYFRTRWRFTGLHACTVHGCLLKADLADQALTANYSRDGLLRWERVEDAQILDAGVCCMPREMRAVSMVWKPLELMAYQSSTPREDAELGMRASWSVLTWRLLEEISRAHHKKVIVQPTTGPLTGVARLVEDLGLVAAPSREGLEQLFASLRENAHVLAAKRFLDGLLVQEAKAVTALSTLPLEDLRQRLMQSAPLGTSRTPHGDMSFRTEREHAISKSALLEEVNPIGGGAWIVDQWIRKKLIATTKVLREGMAFTFIDRCEARRVRTYLLSLIHARDLVQQHDLDWRTYKAIRDTGLLETGMLGMRGYLRRKDVNSLASRLELMSGPANAPSALRWKLFSEGTLFLAEQRSTFLALVRAALDGQIAVYRDLSKPGLSAFSIGVDGVTWLAGRRRAFFCERKWRPRMDQQGLFDIQDEVAAA